LSANFKEESKSNALQLSPKTDEKVRKELHMPVNVLNPYSSFEKFGKRHMPTEMQDDLPKPE